MSYANGVQNIMGMGSANERRCYNVTPSFIGWAHAQNDTCTGGEFVVSSTNKISEDLCHDNILVVWGVDVYSMVG